MDLSLSNENDVSSCMEFGNGSGLTRLSACECVNVINIKAANPPNEDISLQVIVGHSVKASSQDWVGL